MIFNDKYKHFKPLTPRRDVMNDEEVVEPTEERDDERTYNVAEVKVYTCEGCGETFPTGIAKATHTAVTVPNT